MKINENAVLNLLKRHYDLNISGISLFREGGNLSYTVYSNENKYFLKIIRPPFLKTAVCSLEIQAFLLAENFSVIPFIPANTGLNYFTSSEFGEEYIFVLYEYIEGTEPNFEDTEKAGELIGQLHCVMKNYAGDLPKRGRHFFIDRYADILKEKQYDKADKFLEYGNELWERVKDLPQGYCHGDLYRGNVQKSNEKLYVIDFDTSCLAFPMYDVVLFCNDTDYFNYNSNGYESSTGRLNKFLKGYRKYNIISDDEIKAFYDFIAVYHFQLQATMIEIYGYDCVDTDFFDKQYDWLVRWKEQCKLL